MIMSMTIPELAQQDQFLGEEPAHAPPRGVCPKAPKKTALPTTSLPSMLAKNLGLRGGESGVRHSVHSVAQDGMWVSAMNSAGSLLTGSRAELQHMRQKRDGAEVTIDMRVRHPPTPCLRIFGIRLLVCGDLNGGHAQIPKVSMTVPRFPHSCGDLANSMAVEGGVLAISHA